jgi:hypothetical protein
MRRRLPSAALGKMGRTAPALAIWFGWHVLFPRLGAVNWFALVVAAGAFMGMWRWKWNVIPVVLGAGAAGLLSWMLEW